MGVITAPPPSQATAAPSLGQRDLAWCAALFVALWAVFWWSPVTSLSDSRYALLLSHNLLTKGSFRLDGQDIPRNQPIHYGAAELDGEAYQLEIVDGHYYYFFPPGTSLLSLPFVLAQDAAGKSVVRRDGKYRLDREEGNEHYIASILMAALGVVFFLTARLLLPVGWALAIALGGALGTQVWSTASRSLWGHTWGILLLGAVLALLLANETGRRRLPPILVATLLSWAYFVRPTNSLFIIGITGYVMCFARWAFWRYALTGAAWFAIFVGYSWVNFHHLLPSYFAAGRLEATTMALALAGNLIAPSRGLLIYVPIAAFVAVLPLIFWRFRVHARLLGVAVFVSALHYVAISGFVPWYGGGCYGPRYTTELVPWGILVATLGVAAALRWHAAQPAGQSSVAWHTTMVAGGVLLAWSVAINARGATSVAVLQWNQYPVDVDEKPARVWDWRYPQFLAGLVHPPAPEVFPVLPTDARVGLGHEAGRAFMLEGWLYSDPDWCWSAGHEATLIFASTGSTPRILRLYFGAYLHPNPLTHQRVAIRLNGQPLAQLTVENAAPQEYAFPLPEGIVGTHNFLTFGLPDATSPKSLGEGTDPRDLGISLYWLQLDSAKP